MSQSHRRRVPFVSFIVIAAALIGLALVAEIARAESVGSCTRTARDALKSCRYGAYSDYWLALGKCQNLSTKEERVACRREAQEALSETKEECRDQFDAREELCETLGEAPYNPTINPADFVEGIDNPFLPYVPGTTLVYEGESDEGLERIEVKVTHDKKIILGVSCTVVRDTVFLNGELIEDTFDWFAQDKLGNVWYFGEHTEEHEGGVIVSLEGAWEAGVDGAKPGIVMLAHPQLGDLYRQEFLLGEAEDGAEVIGLDKDVKVAKFDTFTGCLQTKDFSSLSPDSLEHKFYAPGIGLVLEAKVEGGERVELIEIIKE